MSRTSKNVNSISQNVVWRFAEQISAQLVSLSVSVVLARLLSPEDYGTLALITVFIAIMQVLVDNGLGNALIQKKNADELDFSTVFWINILFCLVLYLLLFSIAPCIAIFYNKHELVQVTRVLGLTIVISGVKNILQAYVAKKMMFRKFFFATLLGTIGSAIVGIAMAYMGWGIWALVAQRLFNILIDTIILWFTIEWKPKLMFSFSRARELLSYGWKLTATILIDVIYNNARQLIIGKVFSASSLAYYNQGEQFPQVIAVNINASLDSVMFPAMSNVQDKKQQIKELAKKTIKLSSFIMWPMMIGLMVIAEPLVLIVLTEKWLPCVPYFRIFCLIYALYPLQTTNLNAIKATGESGIFLRVQIVKILFGILEIFITLRYGIGVMAFGLIPVSFVCVIINTAPNKKLIHYDILEQIKDILPTIVLSLFMGGIITLWALLDLSSIVQCGVQIASGAVLYIAIAALTKLEGFMMLLNILNRNFRK